MGFWGCKVCNFTKFPLNSWPSKCLVLVTVVMVYKTMLLSNISWSSVNVNVNVNVNGNGKDGVIVLEEKWDYGIRRDKFVEVPQIVWGLNNQKIAFARACLTARMLNRTLLMPSLSASLFYKEIDQLEAISFDKVFQLEKFNSMCNGFVQVSRYSEVLNASDVVELSKGSGRKWTAERDIGQLRDFGNDPYDKYEVIRIIGKNPFLWHDHWPVKEYAKVFECLVLVDEFAKEADRVISRIRRAVPRKTGSLEPAPYMAVHMRIELDWMIHCKKREERSKINEICSSKEEIIQRAGNIKGLYKPLAVYLAVADSLLEDETILSGWDDGLVPFEKKRLGVKDIYDKYPYLIKSAIDYEVCLRADVFVGNSFSTFSSLIVLERTQKMIHLGLSSTCSSGLSWPSYAYNIKGDYDGPKRWMTNMSDVSLQTISYGSNHVSC